MSALRVSSLLDIADKNSLSIRSTMPEDEGYEEEVGRIQCWTGDLRELIKYANDLSSLHPRGHPGGTRM